MHRDFDRLSASKGLGAEPVAFARPGGGISHNDTFHIGIELAKRINDVMGAIFWHQAADEEDVFLWL